MNLEAWDRHNQQYLDAVDVWLRRLLERAAQPRPTPKVALPAVPEPPHPSPRRRFWGTETATPAPIDTAADEAEAAARALDEAVATAAAAVTAAAATKPPPALRILADRFRLSDSEYEVLLLCVGVGLKPDLATLCAKAQGDPQLNYPTFTLAFALSDDPQWDPLLPGHPLRRFELIEIFQPPPTPLTAAALRAEARVVAFAKGITYLDDRLTPVLIPDTDTVPDPEGGLADALEDTLAEIDAVPDRRRPVVQLLGTASATKLALARAACRRLGLPLYRLPVELLPTDPGELDRFVRLSEREARLSPLALYVEGDDPGRASAITRLATGTSGLLFLDLRDVIAAPGRPATVVEVAGPSAAEQETAWATALGDDGAPVAPLLADRFDLAIPSIHRLADLARRGTGGGSVGDRAGALCLAETRRGMDALAERIDARVGWDDLVLPASEQRLLRMIADQVDHRRRVYDEWGFADKTSRGLGINALFAGPSGTGKTMASEVIAHHLGLSLYRIDLSRMVSKYIGETEKNLAKLFDQAEHRGVVLHFDECDALFGKRTEVRDSHDRYANIESSYLLQRIEAFGGLAILATNMKSALDAAFLRRLRFVVDFRPPGEAERTRIWSKVFPDRAELDRIDVDRLGKLTFSGGNIFTIAMNAAFLAARDDLPIRMEHVLEAARAESRKLGRPVDERDFETVER